MKSVPMLSWISVGNWKLPSSTILQETLTPAPVAGLKSKAVISRDDPGSSFAIQLNTVVGVMPLSKSAAVKLTGLAYLICTPVRCGNSSPGISISRSPGAAVEWFKRLRPCVFFYFYFSCRHVKMLARNSSVMDLEYFFKYRMHRAEVYKFC